MALYIPQSILHLARSLYVRPETYGPNYVSWVDCWQYYRTKIFSLIEHTALFVVFLLCLLFAVYCCYRPTSKTTYLNTLAL